MSSCVLLSIRSYLASTSFCSRTPQLIKSYRSSDSSLSNLLEWRDIEGHKLFSSRIRFQIRLDDFRSVYFVIEKRFVVVNLIIVPSDHPLKTERSEAGTFLVFTTTPQESCWIDCPKKSSSLTGRQLGECWSPTKISSGP